MFQFFNVVVVGVIGLVGEVLVGFFDECDFLFYCLYLLVSVELVGQCMGFVESSLCVGDVDSFDFFSVGLVFFVVVVEVLCVYVECVCVVGCLVIDLSGVLELSVVLLVMVLVNVECLVL